MAANVTSAYAIGVTVTSDASQLASGMAQAEQAVEGLATTTQTAAADIDTALATDVPASVDTTAVGLTTKASKFKAVGTELGTSLVGGLSGGLSGPDAVNNTAQSMSGLLAASATTGAGAIAAVGIGLGGVIITNILRGMNESKEKIAELTTQIFDNMELTARTSLADIRKTINETFSLQNVVTDFGGGDYAAGLASIQAKAEDIGVAWQDVLDLLRKGIVPSTEDTYQALIDARHEGTLLEGAFFNSRLQMDGTAKNADDLLTAVQNNNAAMVRGRQAGRDTVAYFDDMADNAERWASASGQALASMQAAAAASSAIASGLQDAAAASLGIKFGE